MTTRIILDCDPGVDDALAMLLAYASPEIVLEAVTTVVGNTDVGTATANALRVAALAGRTDVPVFRGCARPIRAPFERRWASVHGADGLGDAGLPAAASGPAPGHAVDEIIARVLAAPGEITLCPIGPLTNVALAIVKQPEIVPALKGIVLMGGAAFGPGNASPHAEFNFFVDPEAAAIVLSAGAPVVLVGLDVTRKAPITDEWLDRLAAASRVGPAMAAMLRTYGSADPCLHDPCAVAYLLRPDLFTSVEAHLSVVTDSEAVRGAVVATTRDHQLAGRVPNARVLTGCDAEGVRTLIAERLEAL